MAGINLADFIVCARFPGTFIACAVRCALDLNFATVGSTRVRRGFFFARALVLLVGCRFDLAGNLGIWHRLARGGGSIVQFVAQRAKLNDRRHAAACLSRERLLPRNGQLLQVGPGLIDPVNRDGPLLLAVCHQQGVIAQLVHQAGDAIGGPIHSIHGRRFKHLFHPAAGHGDLEPHIVSGFRPIKRFQIGAAGQSLAE